MSTVLEWIALAIVILLGTYLLNNNMMQLNTFITLFMYKKNVFAISEFITDLLDKLSGFNLSSKRVLEIIQLNQIRDNSNTSLTCNGKIEFKNVNFSYGIKKVLNDCNFTVEPNECVLLVGKSGSGKTTIFNLISKLYEVENGTILIDDKNINSLDESFINKNVSIISQNNYLFDMSIKDNLKLAKPDLTDEEMYDICKSVDIHKSIMKMQNKYDTIIGEGGSYLSGGEKQKIAIARSLLLDSKIILFDEVTNHLGSAFHKTIFSLIDKLKKDHTIIFITHEKTLFSKFKKVIKLDNGNVEVIKNK